MFKIMVYFEFKFLNYIIILIKLRYFICMNNDLFGSFDIYNNVFIMF